MARDRKRAKQRRDRARGRTPAVARSGEQGGHPAAADEQPDGASVALPGALEHASADVDEFDAALVRGAGGVPAPLEEQDLLEASDEQGLPDGSEDALQAFGGDAGRGGSGGAGRAAAAVEAARSGLPARLCAVATRSPASFEPAGPSFNGCSGPIAARSHRRPPSYSVSLPSLVRTSASPTTSPKKSSNSSSEVC